MQTGLPWQSTTGAMPVGTPSALSFKRSGLREDGRHEEGHILAAMSRWRRPRGCGSCGRVIVPASDWWEPVRPWADAINGPATPGAHAPSWPGAQGWTGSTGETHVWWRSSLTRLSTGSTTQRLTASGQEGGMIIINRACGEGGGNSSRWDPKQPRWSRPAMRGVRYGAVEHDDRTSPVTAASEKLRRGPYVKVAQVS
jgi:hypothetical protein